MINIQQVNAAYVFHRPRQANVPGKRSQLAQHSQESERGTWQETFISFPLHNIQMRHVRPMASRQADTNSDHDAAANKEL